MPLGTFIAAAVLTIAFVAQQLFMRKQPGFGPRTDWGCLLGMAVIASWVLWGAECFRYLDSGTTGSVRPVETRPVSAPTSQRSTSPQEGTISLAREEVQRWQAAWAKGRKGRVPKWAGGYEILVWPAGLDEKITEEWAKANGVFGASEAEVRTALGQPIEVIPNESVDMVLWVYGNHCIAFRLGQCDGLAPRAKNFEKWFAQPDL